MWLGDSNEGRCSFNSFIYINYKYFPVSRALSQRRKLEGKLYNYCRRFKSDCWLVGTFQNFSLLPLYTGTTCCQQENIPQCELPPSYHGAQSADRLSARRYGHLKVSWSVSLSVYQLPNQLSSTRRQWLTSNESANINWYGCPLGDKKSANGWSISSRFHQLSAACYRTMSQDTINQLF